MFTGIILAVGKVDAIEQRGGDARLTIATGGLAMADVALGDSIAVNGVCLTAVTLGKHQFSADVSNETLSRTTLVSAKVGTAVNLELALTPSTRMGGHIVSGHVDGIGAVLSIAADGRSYRLNIKAPDNLAKYISEKGSICIDGISLTVNSVDGAVFSVNIVPHTWQQTTLGTATVGAKVNLEVDLLARYMERLMLGESAAKSSLKGVNARDITTELLQKSGFI